MQADDPFDLDHWSTLTIGEHRQVLAAAIRALLSECPEVTEVSIEVGPLGREYDLTAAVLTDVGLLRTPLWSHARATIFTDPSIHPANRAQLGPGQAVAEAAGRLRRRLRVTYRLESRGLTFTLSPEEGVQRTWTAEHSLFRKRTAVVREDVVDRPADLDVRDLLAHFYTGPSIRLVSEAGDPFLLPAATDAEGPLVSLCYTCRKWSEGAAATCPDCGGDRVDVVVAARAPRR